MDADTQSAVGGAADDAGGAMAADHGLAVANPLLVGLDAVNAARCAR